MSDYEALAHAHYRAERPAVPVHVLRAVAGEAVVGVLVVAMPVLNGPWRRAAWPGWLDGLAKRDAAEAVNAQVRTIARLVVAPAFRARGVGSQLVRVYLASPLTPRTEALAAMGVLCPVFERAGMRRVQCPPSRTALRVVRTLRERGVPVWALAHGPTRRRLASDPRVARALRSLAVDRWRCGRDRPPDELIERLWVQVASRPVAFVADGGR
jgi:GNAT superfamily N-acetyltransferase